MFKRGTEEGQEIDPSFTHLIQCKALNSEVQRERYIEIRSELTVKANVCLTGIAGLRFDGGNSLEKEPDIDKSVVLKLAIFVVSRKGS